MKVFIVFIVFLFFSCSGLKTKTELKGKRICKEFRPYAVASFSDENVGIFPFCDRFVVIKAKKEREGINAEYKWISENFPGYKRLKQTLAICDEYLIDLIVIKLPNGDLKNMCFDISSFFGKW